MNILLTIDNNYAAQAAACIASVCDNNTEMHIDTYLLTQFLSDENKTRLMRLCDIFTNLSLHIIPLESKNVFAELAASGVDTKGWNEIIVARLLLDRYLPTQVNKILYLDADTITVQTLKPLWSTDLGNSVVGAVIEATATSSQHEALGLHAEPYFNSGVLLINLEKWRNQQIGSKIVNFCLNNKDNLTAFDQDAINAVLKGKIYALPPLYNWCNSFVFYPYKTLRKINHPAPYYDKDLFNYSVQHPAIIHYLGEERPWRTGNTHLYRDVFIHYISIGPFQEIFQMEQGWSLYFTFWNCFNTVFRPLPYLRYLIISKLIPLFLAYRSKQRQRSFSS